MFDTGHKLQVVGVHFCDLKQTRIKLLSCYDVGVNDPEHALHMMPKLYLCRILALYDLSPRSL
jgi:hypothetical protein